MAQRSLTGSWSAKSWRATNNWPPFAVGLQRAPLEHPEAFPFSCNYSGICVLLIGSYSVANPWIAVPCCLAKWFLPVLVLQIAGLLVRAYQLSR